MKSNPHLTLIIVWLLMMFSLIVASPSTFHIKLGWKNYNVDKVLDKKYWPSEIDWLNKELKTGLDIQGGSYILFEANMNAIPESDRKKALESTKDTIERRVNLLGINESLVQTSQIADQYRLIVELPGVTDVREAVATVGQTAQLDFRRPIESTGSAIIDTNATDSAQLQALLASLNQYEKTNLTGADLVRAQVNFDQNTGDPVVGIEFNNEGTKKFSQLTTELVGKQLAIYLDDTIVSAPVVNTPITTGQAIISGNFTIDDATKLAVQLNAGALPVPVKLISQRSIGATIGQDTIAKSVRAGLIGLALVMGFMVAYYGWLGLQANIGLLIYGIITLALYKLLAVTLTLPGIAGFILSIGMAVDANILIFERFKEEIRLKRPPRLAIELAFGRAWDSIRDANICTLIACFILFNPFGWSFLNTSGPIRGFALTLALGISISLFTGVVVTRSLIRVFFVKRK